MLHEQGSASNQKLVNPLIMRKKQATAKKKIHQVTDPEMTEIIELADNHFTKIAKHINTASFLHNNQFCSIECIPKSNKVSLGIQLTQLAI